MQSVGLHAADGRLFPARSDSRWVWAGRPFAAPFGPGDVVGVGVDLARSLLFFTLNGAAAGVALPGNGQLPADLPGAWDVKRGDELAASVLRQAGALCLPSVARHSSFLLPLQAAWPVCPSRTCSRCCWRGPSWRCACSDRATVLHSTLGSSGSSST